MDLSRHCYPWAATDLPEPFSNSIFSPPSSSSSSSSSLMTATTPPLPYFLPPLTLPAELSLLTLDEPMFTPPPSPGSFPPPPRLVRTKRHYSLLECVVCDQPSDDLDALNECTDCALYCAANQCGLTGHKKRTVRHTSYDNVMRELQLAARLLPNYVNTLEGATDFRPSRIKNNGTYWEHMVPLPPLVGVETNPGPVSDAQFRMIMARISQLEKLVLPKRTSPPPIISSPPSNKRMYIEVITTPPASRLVGVETNPGPGVKFAHSTVSLLGIMGDDTTVVNAARVSFAKEIDCLEQSDVKLINYLADKKHWSPFAHPQIQFRIKVPIFVARQWFKHTVGFARNETSRRYVSSEPQFYDCDEWRKAAEHKKQGSSDELVFTSMGATYYANCEQSLFHYKKMIEEGVCPEQARMLLPQSMMTEFIETGSLYAYANLCRLRLDPHAQLEIRIVAVQIHHLLGHAFPHSWKALMKDVPAPPLVGVELNPGPVRPTAPPNPIKTRWPLQGYGNLNNVLKLLIWVHGTCECRSATAQSWACRQCRTPQPCSF